MNYNRRLQTFAIEGKSEKTLTTATISYGTCFIFFTHYLQTALKNNPPLNPQRLQFLHQVTRSTETIHQFLNNGYNLFTKCQTQDIPVPIACLASNIQHSYWIKQVIGKKTKAAASSLFNNQRLFGDN
ncbi:hypothetical protein E3N88_25176 [Mikania micrantha]|uniref:Uncharacterized protein n=1 Tax=Mikania micrantha TaxID=192012 RepID=A0A5N6N6U8_9ASTR|nr:hypothetical protein E3N88_25176 [Mikania micrantha]